MFEDVFSNNLHKVDLLRSMKARFLSILQIMNSGSTILALKEAALHLIVFPESSSFSNWHKSPFCAILVSQ